ncbi:MULTISPECIES: phosphodiester glycosidase family protein [unclassified Treponema]|uniref:phosphodiester glycosidase family protein n=1 Tax=unclassified Treponema TaxID=2638727 RepID=UPI0020A33A28|nr:MULTISPECIES: phosphodiester glycosidase family protein [unclassified Treponema]UTC66505.1 phosphodiester glycosidase family protein [Treponema sp. OMZ 789]UTC69237.1 phosphodiester glycosidase family protein [Treponema sp. OMZ 790]UTC71950.1 phosphodiester glycosidase family protein [Treponema sp. OMZ 791]
MFLNSKQNKFVLFFIFSFFLFCSCQSIYKKHSPDFSFIENSKKEFVWEELTKGVWISHIEYEDYPLIVHAVKLDLTNPKLKIVVTESELFNDKGMVKRETTLSFAKRHNTIVSVNASFFKLKSFLFSSRGEPIGIHIDKKIHLSKPFLEYGALCFSPDNSAFIIEKQKLENLVGIEYAVSGHKVILKNGKAVIADIIAREDSRTCAGIDEDGKTLFIFFAEAENKKKSRGITFNQAYFFMRKLGASHALHLDGGGSSTLIIKRKNNFFVEVPSISNFSLRKVVTNLGFIIE